MEEKIDRYAFSITYVDGRAELREDVLPSSKATNKNVQGSDVTDEGRNLEFSIMGGGGQATNRI